MPPSALSASTPPASLGQTTDEAREDSLPPQSADTVRAFFQSFLAQDRAAADRLVAEDFVFTSPQDDHIDRAAWFERCFPTADRFTSYELLEVTPTEGDGVFALYEYELGDGQRYRNAEFITAREGRITEAQVFFGGRF
jgi:ketosteroid isomerase-like protein